MSRKYWSNKAKTLTPYTAGEQPQLKDIIKLNTNENPYPPSPKAIEVIKNFDFDRLRLYPHPDALQLKHAAAKIHGVSEQNIFCGNGSDEVIALAFQAFFDTCVTLLGVTYSFYPVWAQMYGLKTRTIPLKEDFSVDIDQISGENCILPNPNAPTGVAITLDQIEKILSQIDNVLIIDEAYIDFGGASAIPLTQKYDNLLVVRTLSKSHSLAGLRVGYAVGNENLIGALNTLKDSFNSYPVDALACIAGATALLDVDYTEATAKKIVRTRESVKTGLEKLGFYVLPSCANFLFAAHGEKSALDIMRHLRNHGVIARHFNAPKISEFLRISIGTDEQMQRMLEVLSLPF